MKRSDRIAVVAILLVLVVGMSISFSQISSVRSEVAGDRTHSEQKRTQMTAQFAKEISSARLNAVSEVTDALSPRLKTLEHDFALVRETLASMNDAAQTFAAASDVLARTNATASAARDDVRALVVALEDLRRAQTSVAPTEAGAVAGAEVTVLSSDQVLRAIELGNRLDQYIAEMQTLREKLAEAKQRQGDNLRAIEALRTALGAK